MPQTPDKPKRHRNPTGLPPTKPADVKTSRICTWCASVRDESEFQKPKGPCNECRDKQALQAAGLPVQDKLDKASALFGNSAASLDQILELLLSEMGGEKAFIVLLAQQIRVAFDEHPGRASNINMGFKLLELCGVRDNNQTNRELKDASLESLRLERNQVYAEIVLSQFSDDQRKSLAMQLLRSLDCDEMVVDALGITVNDVDSDRPDDGTEGQAEGGPPEETGSGDRDSGAGGAPDLPPAGGSAA